MANEKRLVDVNPLMKDGWHLVKTGKSNVFIASMSLADVQTVEAVEIVRCRDCKHRYSDSWCEYVDDDDNFYCARGERKDGGEK